MPMIQIIIMMILSLDHNEMYVSEIARLQLDKDGLHMLSTRIAVLDTCNLHYTILQLCN